ncbi:2,3-diaminopropionate biosynthesis protein SbnA [Melghirimyces algeriensis]|uniref:N-(2-amino-2-carboxyethyl)-L-glutamate synthase n=1 Tax=Melghirimyces algeriensis TaxID=910412 RepID=A0A521F2A5_9BACL|nr:2,3-diaminopropionate biosynthesis protein SbnA [Melghirimyces algeriensis]SMO90303.1 cysteine synthase A [Melghirimyces algeriensis]
MITDTTAESGEVKSSILDCVGNTPLVSLDRLFPEKELQVISKLELMNPGGSMKDRTARYMIEQGIENGTIPHGAHLIESSSGNLGIAIAMACRILGLSFTCVVDPKTTETNVRILRQLGATVEMVQEPDENGGYLQSRIRRVKELLHKIPDSYWINQYANENNWKAHYNGTATEMVRQLNRSVDVFFAAVSTTGSLLGCTRKLREHFPSIRVIAVDAVGSILFGGPPGKREIPGIGSSRVPELLSPEEIDDVVYVSDLEASWGCRELLEKEGIFAGGSSGSIVAAIQKYLPALPRPCRILTLFPDRGDRYLDLVYNDDWVKQLSDEKTDEPQLMVRERV